AVKVFAAGHLELPGDFDIVSAAAIGRHPLDFRAELPLAELLFESRFEGLGSRSIGGLEGTSDESNLHDDFSKFLNKVDRRTVARRMARPMLENYLTLPAERERITWKGCNGSSDRSNRGLRKLGEAAEASYREARMARQRHARSGGDIRYTPVFRVR